MTDESATTWQKIKKLFSHEVWDLDLSSLSGERVFLVRLVRVGQLVIKGFKEDDLFVHASALTFVTLTSLVPMLAVVFALLKGFGFGQDQINHLMDWKDSMPAEFQAFIDNVVNIVSSTNFSALGWVGLAFLIFTAVMVLGSIEVSFNRVWGVATPRAMLRQVANYTSVLVLVPFLIGIAGTMEAALRSGSLLLPETVGGAVRSLLRLTSVFTTWMGFLCLYVFVPNTRVRFMPSVVSSLCAGLLFMFWQKSYISLQLGVAKYNAIYGTFASIPIFLAWLYISWVIILLGAELAFALQNSSTFQMERASANASPQARLLLALSVLQWAAEALTTAKPRFDTSSFAREHKVPIRFLNEMVRVLVRAGLLAETADKGGTFVLLKTPDSVKVRDVVDMVLQEGARPESLGLAHTDPRIEQVLATLNQGVAQTLDQTTLLDLVGRR